MKIEYFHGSIYGNGVKVAEEFKKQMEVKGVIVNINNIRGIKPREIPPADLYLFSSPGRLGRPTRNIQNFLKKANLSSGTKYAVIVTELNPNPNRNTMHATSEENADKCQQVLPTINKILQAKGLEKVTEGKIFVTGIKGPLEDQWQKIVEEFVSQIPILPNK